MSQSVDKIKKTSVTLKVAIKVRITDHERWQGQKKNFSLYPFEVLSIGF